MDNEKNEKCEMPKNTNYNLRKKKHTAYSIHVTVKIVM